MSGIGSGSVRIENGPSRAGLTPTDLGSTWIVMAFDGYAEVVGVECGPRWSVRSPDSAVRWFNTGQHVRATPRTPRRQSSTA